MCEVLLYTLVYAFNPERVLTLYSFSCGLLKELLLCNSSLP